MQYFTKDYIDYFKDLGSNNNKEWFHDNKKRYEKSVKKPFSNFVSDLINEVQKTDATVAVKAKDCISRINRDIRFSKDKTPYNLHLNAFISSGGKKNKSIPGLYVRLSPEMIGVMGGCYTLDKDQLTKLRSALAIDSSEINSLINEISFVENFGVIKGEKMKRIPKEFKSAADIEPLMFYKSIYYMSELDSKLIHSKELMSQILFKYSVMTPLNTYLKSIITK